MSAASQVFLVLVAMVVLIASAFALYLAVDSGREVRADAEKITATLAATISADEAVAEAVQGRDPHAELQPYAERVMRDTPIDFVTIMYRDGIRLTHVDPANIGKKYAGTLPAPGQSLTEEYGGSLGQSVRTIVPLEVDGTQVGWVSVGVTLDRITGMMGDRLPPVIACFAVVLVIGVLGAIVARRITRNVAGSLALARVHEAVETYESIRPLREALHVQTHEHGNRMHTVIALLELDRKDEAIELLLEHATESQDLVTSMAFGGDDPTSAALLLQKAAEARARGIAWTADIIPSTPRSALTPLEMVSLLGNLIDNALDAAEAHAQTSGEPAWVNVRIGPDASAPEALGGDSASGVRIVVRDSGGGVARGLEKKVFEFGFSTKAAPASGRGVGLSVVLKLVEDAGGSLALTNDPTTVLVHLPEVTE